jgi:DOPA 4,5-dioxygenase
MVADTLLASAAAAKLPDSTTCTNIAMLARIFMIANPRVWNVVNVPTFIARRCGMHHPASPIEGCRECVVPNFLLDVPAAVEDAFSRRRRASPSGTTDNPAILPVIATRDRTDLSSMPTRSRMSQLPDYPDHAPYHAHIYYEAATRAQAMAANQHLRDTMACGGAPRLLFVGSLKDGKAGPHPIPQFEIHFTRDALADVRAFIEASGFTALIHPLTDDDLADHTSLAEWIGTPLAMDLTTLDPPGRNQGVARFGVSDF